MASGLGEVAFECPHCGRRRSQKSWVVVDFGDHPELAEEIATGRLNIFPCPQCGQPGCTTKSLLVDLRRNVPLLFAPDRHADEQLTREQLFASMVIHRGKKGPGEWVTPRALPVEHELLPIVVARDLEADLIALQSGSWQADSIALQRYGKWLETVVAAGREDEMKAAYETLVRRSDGSKSLTEVVRAHPILLSEEADRRLERLQDMFEDDGPPEAEKQVRHWRFLLRLCRRDGVDKVLGRGAASTEEAL